MNEQRVYDILRQDVEVPRMVDKKLAETYARLEGGQRPARRKGPRPVRVVLVAAAVIMACALCIAAAMPARVFHLVSGATAVFQQTADNRAATTISGAMPLELEEGRLWLVVNGERTDITDRIDMETPYIYDNTDPDTGVRDYLVAGGIPEDYGWIEFHELEDGSFIVTGAEGNVSRTYCVIDGTAYDFVNDFTEEQRAQIDRQMREGLIDPESVYDVWAPWYVNASESLMRLGIPDFLTYGGNSVTGT